MRRNQLFCSDGLHELDSVHLCYGGMFQGTFQHVKITGAKWKNYTEQARRIWLLHRYTFSEGIYGKTCHPFLHVMLRNVSHIESCTAILLDAPKCMHNTLQHNVSVAAWWCIRVRESFLFRRDRHRFTASFDDSSLHGTKTQQKGNAEHLMPFVMVKWKRCPYTTLSR